MPPPVFVRYCITALPVLKCIAMLRCLAAALTTLFGAGCCVHRCVAPVPHLAACHKRAIAQRDIAQAVKRGQPRRVQQRRVTASASLGAAASPARQPDPAHLAPLRAVAAAAAAAWHALAARVAEAVLAAQQRLATADSAAINVQIRSSVRQARTLSAVAPFAAAATYTGTTSNTLLLLTRAVASFIKARLVPVADTCCSLFVACLLLLLSCLSLPVVLPVKPLLASAESILISELCSSRSVCPAGKHPVCLACPSARGQERQAVSRNFCLYSEELKRGCLGRAAVPPAAVPARAAVLVPRLQLGAPAVAHPAPGAHLPAVHEQPATVHCATRVLCYASFRMPRLHAEPWHSAGECCAAVRLSCCNRQHVPIKRTFQGFIVHCCLRPPRELLGKYYFVSQHRLFRAVHDRSPSPVRAHKRRSVHYCPFRRKALGSPVAPLLGH